MTYGALSDWVDWDEEELRSKISTSFSNQGQAAIPDLLTFVGETLFGTISASTPDHSSCD
jgi:hypothetical protein